MLQFCKQMIHRASFPLKASWRGVGECHLTCQSKTIGRQALLAACRQWALFMRQGFIKVSGRRYLAISLNLEHYTQALGILLRRKSALVANGTPTINTLLLRTFPVRSCGLKPWLAQLALGARRQAALQVQKQGASARLQLLWRCCDG